MSSKYKPSFWEEDTFFQPYDLLIIGAGITGLMSALFYKRAHPNRRVAVLERGFIPRGASTRNAGFACIGSISEHLSDLQKASEEHINQRIIRRYKGLQLLKETLGEEDIGYDPCGGYELFTSEDAFDKAAAGINRFNKRINELLGESEVYHARELNGYPVIYNRLEGGLHPGKMMQKLIRQVQNCGVEIKWNTTVEDITDNGRVSIAGRPFLKADKILVSANAFTRRLLPHIQVKPGRGYVFITDEQQSLPWKGTFHHDRGYIYFRNVGNRLLIGGARNIAADQEETVHFGTNETIKEHLIDFVSDKLKLSQEWRIYREWSGIMGFTDTKTPVIRQLDEHRYVAAGLSGMGIAIGSSIGREAAEMLT